MDDKTYCGDGVYAMWDGFGIELRVNDIDQPSDVVYLEPEVMQVLIDFFESKMEIKDDEK